MGWRLAIRITARYVTSSGYAYNTDMCAPNPSGLMSNTNWTYHYDLWRECSGSYGGATGWPMWTDMVDGRPVTHGTLTVYNSSGVQIGSTTADQ
ncbi:RIP homotypic interaction motif-containing protein [Microbispora sp. ATCC PTA-5024]|uniref:RIP homotypic interaction motif-containing protein n=1 Tax=Microbispora sp. ATCC PTA-5024 TaxID=316330 RepID=UPI0003DCAFF5|nr:RIP homotypic interaction motif-containing protein [Microbispora sp. ATCC PTA-5024]ETK37800.1 hypothetical protein MPTA5024_01985 [Microbispora sp. ATCC PTA-5024]